MTQLRFAGTTEDVIVSGHDGQLIRRTTWTTLMLQLRSLAIAPDGLLVGASTRGVIWIYSIPRRGWICLPAGTIDLKKVIISERGEVAATLDVEGRLRWIALNAAGQRLHFPGPPTEHRHHDHSPSMCCDDTPMNALATVSDRR